MLITVARWLDKHEFLHYRLWEFSLRNCTRPFPYYYLFRVLLFHPVKAFRGFTRYQQLVRESNKQPLMGTQPLADLFQQGKINPRHFVLAPGFCLKPFDEKRKKAICPVGFFNHRCLVLEKSEMAAIDQQIWQKPCDGCSLGSLAQIAWRLKINFYILTSAMDIARDFFLPAIKSSGAGAGLFLLCRYSAEAFTWGLATAGIEGALITFASGDCLNHQDFTQADVGRKEKQTAVEPPLFNHLKTQLLHLGEKWSQREPLIASSYLLDKNIYRPNYRS